MDHIEGSLRIQRLSGETEPEPWKYEMSFALRRCHHPPACDIVGDDQLGRALRHGLALREPDVGTFIDKAPHNRVVIHHVQLTDELKTALGQRGYGNH